MGSSILEAVRSLRRKGIEVLYLDKKILVINKPGGLVAQSTLSEEPPKLVRWYLLLRRFRIFMVLKAQSITPTMEGERISYF